MDDLNSLLDSHFLQEVTSKNLSEITFLTNPKSLLDVIELSWEFRQHAANMLADTTYVVIFGMTGKISKPALPT